MIKHKRLLFSILINVLIFAIIGFVIYWVVEFLLPGLWPIIENGDEAEIEHYIRAQGSVVGVLILGILQMLQVVSVVFPGMPIQIAAGIIEGPLLGFLVCYGSYVLANVLVFLVIRKLGNKLGARAPSEGKRASKLVFISESQHPEFMVVVACMMPLLPNGIVPYVAARNNKITFKKFFVSVLIGSPLTILVFCLIGNKLLQGNFVYSALILGGLFAIAILTFVFRDKICAIIYKKSDTATVHARQNGSLNP